MALMAGIVVMLAYSMLLLLHMVVVVDEPRQGEGRILLLGVDPGLLIRRVRVMVLGFATTL